MKLTKRILAVMLSFLMIIASANIVVLGADESGADEPTITVSSATAKQGDTVDVTVSMTGNPGIIGLILDVEYNTSVLTLTGVTDSGALSGGMHKPTYDGSSYRLAWENDTVASNLMVEGKLATLHFKVNDDAAAGDYDITASVPTDGILNYEMKNVDFALVNGTVTVEAGEEEPVIPEDAAKIVVSNGRGRAGETVEVTISLENNPGIISMRLFVDYNKEYITLTDVTDAKLLPDAVHGNNYADNPYTLTWSDDTSTEDYKVDGTVVTLTFTVAADAPADISVPLRVYYDPEEVYDKDLNSVEFYVVNGAVEIIDYICGDVNADGKVNTRDKTILARHLANWSGYTAEDIDMDAADVNKDGKVNTRDKTILARHLANWSEYAELPYVK